MLDADSSDDELPLSARLLKPTHVAPPQRERAPKQKKQKPFKLAPMV